MITLEQYVGKWANSPDWTDDRISNATANLAAVNALLKHYESETGKEVKINPATGSQVSGQTYGGFRPQNCPQGAPHSSHKEGLAVDVYDPDNAIDEWLNDFEGENGDNHALTEYGLYREHPDATNHWLHLSVHAPKSGRRTFVP